MITMSISTMAVAKIVQTMSRARALSNTITGS